MASFDLLDVAKEVVSPALLPYFQSGFLRITDWREESHPMIEKDEDLTPIVIILESPRNRGKICGNVYKDKVELLDDPKVQIQTAMTGIAECILLAEGLVPDLERHDEDQVEVMRWHAEEVVGTLERMIGEHELMRIRHQAGI